MVNVIPGLLASLSLLMACGNSTDKEIDVKKDSPVAISDTIPTGPVTAKDEMGCNTANGETWSIVRKNCVVLENIGTRMEPQQAGMDKSKPAWLVFSDDKVRVEIILPTQKKPVIIRKSSADGEPGKWANGPLTLSEINGIYTLEDEGKLLYKSK